MPSHNWKQPSDSQTLEKHRSQQEYVYYLNSSLYKQTQWHMRQSLKTFLIVYMFDTRLPVTYFRKEKRKHFISNAAQFIKMEKYTYYAAVVFHCFALFSLWKYLIHVLLHLCYYQTLRHLNTEMLYWFRGIAADRCPIVVIHHIYKECDISPIFQCHCSLSPLKS